MKDKILGERATFIQPQLSFVVMDHIQVMCLLSVDVVKTGNRT